MTEEEHHEAVRLAQERVLDIQTSIFVNECAICRLSRTIRRLNEALLDAKAALAATVAEQPNDEQ